MSRAGGLKVSTGGYGDVSPSLQGLAIITENDTLPSPVPDISIDESFLTSPNKEKTTKSRAELSPDVNHFQKSVAIPPASLCGARIAVYRRSVGGQSKSRSIATIGGVFRLGQRHFALTTAHVFFDNNSGTGSWADSGLYVTSNSTGGINPEISVARIAETYEIVIESYWPNAADPYYHEKPTNVYVGLVEPSVLHRRKRLGAATLPEVIWNDELDWALIELTETAFWQLNTLHVSSETTLQLRPPSSNLEPPCENVIVAGGVSGYVLLRGARSAGDVHLPWAKSTIQTWTLEGEISTGDYGSLVVEPNSGIVYGMVISHDPDTMLTHIVPAPTMFESILNHHSEEFLSLDSIFSFNSHATSTTTLVENGALEEFARTPVIRSADTDVKYIYLSTLKNFSMQAIDGRRFVKRSALVQWLLSPRRDGIPHIEFMLDDAYPRNAMLPITSSQIAGEDDTSLVVFALLFELGRGELIHLFMRQGLTDKRLPFDLSLLNEAVDRIGLPDEDHIAREIYDCQWTYCPMTFDLEMERDVPTQIVIPIHQKQQINSKGGTAMLWRITVLEEFVSKRLQAVSTKSRFNDQTDKLGFRYHFAVKSFAKQQFNFFESEVTAFKAFRDVPSMIGYLGNFHYTGVRTKRRATSFSSSERSYETGSSPTNNILLEYGDFDLDEYFAATTPPVLSIQVTQFWQEIAAIAEAISEIHRFSTQRAGVRQEYSGWHADIKPDNILNVKGSFKLADPGFARFEKSDKKLTRLVGGTKTYGSPEAHSTQRLQELTVSQAIDIWSLGCVLSVAATWVILGWSGITQFQQLRIEALKRRSNRTRSLSRGHARSRSRSRNFGQGSGMTLDVGPKSSMSEGDCFHDGEKVLEEVRHWHNFLRSVVRKSDEVSVQILDLVDEKMLVSNPGNRIEAAELYRQMRLIVHGCEISSQNSTPDIVSHILLKTDIRSMLGAPKLSAMTLSSIKTDADYTSPASGNSGRALHLLSPHSPLSPKLMTAAASTTSLSSSSSEAVPAARPTALRNIALNEAASLSVPSSIDVPVAKFGVSKGITGLKPARRMSVSQARTELEKKKKMFSRKRKDPFLMKHLENRDIEFLVDNGDTMAKHWPEAKELVEILCAMVSDIDKDGFDLGFTNGPVKLKQKSNTKAVKPTLDNEHAKPATGVRTDMAAAIDKTLAQYHSRLTSKASRLSSSSVKKFTLIVLTDGVWRGTSEPTAVEDTIVRRINEIARAEGPRRDPRGVTIQFIQFGHDEEARGRLETLDRGLIDYEIPDVIDTEPSNGNVWKMLLGSVDASFDYADSGV